MTATNQNGSLKVILTPDETVGFGINEFFFDADSPIVSKALLCIFKTACKQACFKTTAEKLDIEIHPFFTGGCEVLFIPEAEKKRVAVHPISRKSTLTAEFKNSQALLDGIEQLFLLGNSPAQSSLYWKDGCYRLTVKQPFSKAVLNRIDCEVYTSPIILAKTVEHWKPLCLDNAIETVGKALKRT